MRARWSATAAHCSSPRLQGAGKTSIALRLVLAGARLLADDAVAIDARWRSPVGAPGRRDARSPRGGAAPAPAPGSRASWRRAPVCRQDALRRQHRLADRSRRRRCSCCAGPTRGCAGRSSRRLDPIDPFRLLATTFNLSVRTPERLTATARHVRPPRGRGAGRGARGLSGCGCRRARGVRARMGNREGAIVRLARGAAHHSCVARVAQGAAGGGDPRDLRADPLVDPRRERDGGGAADPRSGRAAEPVPWDPGADLPRRPAAGPHRRCARSARFPTTRAACFAR